jgi:competence protein ComEC
VLERYHTAFVRNGAGLDDAARARVQGLGMAHLLALSGMHAAIVGAVLLWPWRHRGRRAMLFVLPVLGAWVVVAGAGPSLVRAVGMVAWWVVARRSGRRADVADALAVVALCELACRPQLLCGVGWWLSYAATLAVIRAASATRNWPRLASAVGVSSAAQLATLPWVLDAFGFVNLLAPLTLLVVAPVFGLALTLGLAGVVAGAAMPGLSPWSDPLVISAGHAFGLTLRVVEPASDLVVWTPGLDGIRWAAALAAVGCGLWPARVQTWLRGLVATALCAFALWPTSTEHEWVLFDVGQGDGAVLRCGRQALVIDTGPRYDEAAPASWTIVDWLRRRRLDDVSVLVTHGHLDHGGGLGTLLGSGIAGEVVLAAIDRGRPWADRAARAAGAHGVDVRWVAAGDTLEVGHCRLGVLWPPRAATGLHTNDRSVVLEWAVAGRHALSGGDLERAGERGLGTLDPHAWLKVSHHGGDTGNDASVLAALAPEHALVSCGAGNRYGHPHPAVLARLEDAGALVHRTDQCGFLRVRWSDERSAAVLDCGHPGCP